MTVQQELIKQLKQQGIFIELVVKHRPSGR